MSVYRQISAGSGTNGYRVCRLHLFSCRAGYLIFRLQTKIESEEIYMIYRYKTKGTCSVFIDVDVENGVLKQAVFHGGCNGNLQGISSLAAGLSYDELKEKLSGIKCGFKSTSCPDQLIKAMEEAMAQEEAGSK